MNSKTIFMVLIACVFMFAGCGLSRDKAAKAIEEKVITNYAVQRAIAETVMINEVAGNKFKITLDVEWAGSSWGTNPMVILLKKAESSGYMKMISQEQVFPGGFGKRYVYWYEITGKGAPFIRLGGNSAQFLLGKVDRVEVNGITDISDNIKRVEYTVNFQSNDFARDIGKVIQPIKNATSFRKYDDGWRLQEL